MILLSSIIQIFGTKFLSQYPDRLLPSQLHAFNAMKHCRSEMSPRMRVECSECDKTLYVPHSCGHRHCPHCQSHESQQWIEHQLKRQVPAHYFLITFTLPREFRPLAYGHQSIVYDLMMRCSWEVLRQFAKNDRHLGGMAGAISVLHTHSRRLDFHPHVHVVMPAGVVDVKARLWRTKGQKKAASLFNHKALAKVFRAKMLHELRQADRPLPSRYPHKWVVHCQSVGNGQKALVYLGRYLYKGVLPEKQIIACENGMVTFRYQESHSKKWRTRTLPGEKFLWLLLQHCLPKGFRRTRNYGFLHPNSKQMITLLQWMTGWVAAPMIKKHRPVLSCPCCGQAMVIVATQLPRPSKPKASMQGEPVLEPPTGGMEFLR